MKRLNTVKKQRDDLLNTAMDVFSKVNSIQATVDTVQARTKTRLTLQAKAALKRLQPGKVIRGQCHKDIEYPYRVRLQQPTRQSLMLFYEVFPDHKINRFDISHNFVVYDDNDREALQMFIRGHVSQPWRGSREVMEFENTWYNAQAWTKRGTVEYSNRLSKLTNEPVCHVEERITHTRVCEGYGVYKTIDLLGIDPTEVARRLCRLTVINWAKFEKNVQDLAQKSYKAHKLTGYSWFSLSLSYWLGKFGSYPRRLLTSSEDSLMTEEALHGVDVQRVIDLNYCAFRGALIHIPITPFLRGTQLSWPAYP